MEIHQKKIIQPYFDLVRYGVKTFEIRKNDCDYQAGDIIILTEFDKQNKQEFYNEITVLIKYVLKDYEFIGITKGYCVLGIEVLKDGRT